MIRCVLQEREKLQNEKEALRQKFEAELAEMQHNLRKVQLVRTWTLAIFKVYFGSCCNARFKWSRVLIEGQRFSDRRQNGGRAKVKVGRRAVREFDTQKQPDRSANNRCCAAH